MYVCTRPFLVTIFNVDSRVHNFLTMQRAITGNGDKQRTHALGRLQVLCVEYRRKLITVTVTIIFITVRFFWKGINYDSQVYWLLIWARCPTILLGCCCWNWALCFGQFFFFLSFLFLFFSIFFYNHLCQPFSSVCHLIIHHQAGMTNIMRCGKEGREADEICSTCLLEVFLLR